MGHADRCVIFLAATLMLVACGESRDRPQDPVSPDGGGGGSSPTNTSTARVQIVSPVEGDTVLRETLIEAPGQEVVLTGSFDLGQSVILEGFANRYGPIPFYSEDLAVETTGSQQFTRFFRAEVRHLEESNRALLVARVKDSHGTLVAGDSIRVELR